MPPTSLGDSAFARWATRHGSSANAAQAILHRRNSDGGSSSLPLRWPAPRFGTGGQGLNRGDRRGLVGKASLPILLIVDHRLIGVERIRSNLAHRPARVVVLDPLGA